MFSDILLRTLKLDCNFLQKKPLETRTDFAFISKTRNENNSSSRRPLHDLRIVNKKPIFPGRDFLPCVRFPGLQKMNEEIMKRKPENMMGEWLGLDGLGDRDDYRASSQ